MMRNCGYEIRKNRLDGSAVSLVCVKARLSIERRQSEMYVMKSSSLCDG